MKDSFLNRKFKYTYSNACMYIIIANVLVYFLTQFTDISYMGLSLQGWLSLIPSLVNKGFVWQLFTYMFVHQNYMHLFFNMFALLMFGRALERELGKPLMLRRGRTVSLTPAGEVLQREARKILEMAEQAKEKVKSEVGVRSEE